MKLIFHGIGHYASGREFGPARWPHTDLLAVREGRLRIQTDGGVLQLGAGDALWIPAGVRFWGISEVEASVMWVMHFSDRKWRMRDVSQVEECGVGVIRGAIQSALANDLMNRLDELYLGVNRFEPFAEVYFTALLAEIRRNGLVGPRENRWLQQLKDWAVTELASGIGIREMAKTAGLSESHLRLRFRKENGGSVGQFLRGLRLQEAEKLVRQTPLGLKEISMRVGYSDPVAFHRAFAQRFGVPPGAYRRRVQAAL